MRLLAALLAVSSIAVPLEAGVKMTVLRDGGKVIMNDGRGGRPGTSASALQWLAKQHDRRTQYDVHIMRYAEQYDVNPTLVRAVIQVESNFDPKCVSVKGARGLMQLMPATAKRFGVTDVHDPEQNIRGGVRYLAYLTKLFNGDMRRVLAGYNAGEGAVMRYGGIPPYEETANYVVRALTVYNGRPYGSAVSFAGSRGGPKLKGGFVQPVAAALIPGARVLGTH